MMHHLLKRALPAALLLLAAGLAGCDDDDNPMASQDDINRVETLVTADTFVISSFIDSGEDETNLFRCYSFSFNEDGSIVARSENDMKTGTWRLEPDDDGPLNLEFIIDFGPGVFFDELNDDWDVSEYTESTIALADIDEDEPQDNESLSFQAGTAPAECTPGALQQSIEAALQDGSWRITRMLDSGENETAFFSGYNFTFSPSGVLSANNGSTTYEGSWYITDSSNGNVLDDLELRIYFETAGDTEFEELNDDWDFISHSESEIRLIDIDDDNSGDTDELTFEKN